MDFFQSCSLPIGEVAVQRPLLSLKSLLTYCWWQIVVMLRFSACHTHLQLLMPWHPHSEASRLMRSSQCSFVMDQQLHHWWLTECSCTTQCTQMSSTKYRRAVNLGLSWSCCSLLMCQCRCQLVRWHHPAYIHSSPDNIVEQLSRVLCRVYNYRWC